MSVPTLKDRATLLQEWIRRFVAYSTDITWFGASGVMYAWAFATASAVEGAYQLYTAVLRRFTLMAASGESLALVALERGSRRLSASAARVLVVVRPESSVVTAITLGPPDVVEVADSSIFEVGASFRIRSADGATYENAIIVAITSGTGPNGGDELELDNPLTNTYSPSTENVVAICRVTLPAGTQIATSVGVVMETLRDVTTGEANPILDGEGGALSLADKVWCEATTRGVDGNIPALTVTQLVTPVTGILEVLNPEEGFGGAAEEEDGHLKRRTITAPAIANQETHAWILAMAQAGNQDVLRARKTTTSSGGTMAALVLSRAGGPFSTNALDALSAYAEDRVRSYMAVEFTNVTLTSVEVEARIRLAPGTDLRTVWKAAAVALANHIDTRKWAWGEDVDNSDLLAIVTQTPGVASLETSTFLPAAAVAVADESLPTLVRLSLQDIASGETINADLAQSF